MAIIINASEALDRAVEIIRSGGIVAYPTETTYGLAVDPFNEEAVNKLFKLKGRSYSSPVSLIVSDIEMAESLTEEIPLLAKKLMEKFWPGALTIIFKAKDNVPKTITAGRGKVGLRVSSSPTAGRLVKEAAMALTATSANPTGETAATTAEEVAEYFGDRIEVIIDGGRLTETTPSTVVEVRENKLIIIREGTVSRKDLEENL